MNIISICHIEGLYQLTVDTCIIMFTYPRDKGGSFTGRIASTAAGIKER
jgi:hypothetical protein